MRDDLGGPKVTPPRVGTSCLLHRESGTVEVKRGLEDSEVAREAWRSMKAGRIALSFGYIVTSDFKREDGVRELLGVDLFEISLTPSPANRDTRILAMKSASRGADDLAGIFNDFLTGKSKAAHDRRRMDREVAELAAELEAKRAMEAKRNRPIRIRSFPIE